MEGLRDILQVGRVGWEMPLAPGPWICRPDWGHASTTKVSFIAFPPNPCPDLHRSQYQTNHHFSEYTIIKTMPVPGMQPRKPPRVARALLTVSRYQLPFQCLIPVAFVLGRLIMQCLCILARWGINYASFRGLYL